MGIPDGVIKMYSWEIDNYLKSKNYKLTFQEVKNVMINSPQINFWKMEELFSNIPNYGKYTWATTDGYHWDYYILNSPIV